MLYVTVSLHSKLVFLLQQILGIAGVILVCCPITTFTLLTCFTEDSQFSSQEMREVKPHDSYSMFFLVMTN